MPIDPEHARQRLLTARAEIVAMRALSSEERAAVTLDQASVGRLSRMDAMQRQHMAAATERQRMFDLNRIEAALRRIDDGDYGICLECEEPIAEKRLEVDPAAALCMRCAQLGER